MGDLDSPRRSKSAALRTARQQRMADWFERRRWRVADELTFENADLRVESGEFWVLGGQVFRTPFGNKGRHGYILQEIDPRTGADVWTGEGERRAPSRAPFGWVTMNHASGAFPGSIVVRGESGNLVPGVPPRPYGKKPPDEALD